MSPLPPLLLKGDCLDELKRIPDESIDAVVTDPPYGLGFMGKKWDVHTPLDYERFCEAWATECMRILKPGGHLLAFGGSRTWHRLQAGIEDAGFEIRDSIAWLYGSGFPKSLDVSKAIDKALGVEGSFGAPKSAAHAAHIGKTDYSGADKDPGWERPWMHDAEAIDRSARVYEGGSDQAKAFEGWGTALKPAFEPVVVARKPLTGTVASNVLAYGTGALNIDASRIATDEDRSRPPRTPNAILGGGKGTNLTASESNPAGRWPTNVVLDESQAAELDRQSGFSQSPTQTGRGASSKASSMSGTLGAQGKVSAPGDGGGASRFFPTFKYQAKAPKSERPVVDGVAHPTVKPLTVMRWLVRLVTPPGGCVVDPFAGSGATLEAAYLEGFECIGVELTPEYWPLVQARIDRVVPSDDDEAA